MSDEDLASLPIYWEKLKVLSVVLASILVPVAIAVVGSAYSRATKEKEIGAQYVELAIGILRTEPNERNRALRTWAIKVVNHYSSVALHKEAVLELQLQQLMAELKERHVKSMKPIKEIR